MLKTPPFFDWTSDFLPADRPFLTAEAGISLTASAAMSSLHD